MNEEKKVVIIGAGIAGLSAGCYLQANGYQTEIYEASQQSGGLCAAWTRGDYTFDPCLNWLAGTNPADPLNKIWQELDAVNNKSIIDFEEFIAIESRGNKMFYVYSDIEKLSAEMKKIAPEDRVLIDELIDVIKKVSRMKCFIEKAPELYTLIEKVKFGIKHLSFYPVFLKWGKISLKDYVLKFKNQFLKEVLVVIAGDERNSVLSLILLLSLICKKSAGYPAGGAADFVKSIESKYLNLGGKINFNSKVSSIIVKENKAAGIKLFDGMSYDADKVISAADGYTTIFKMLDGKYLNKKIINYYNEFDLYHSIIQVCLGIDGTFNDVPHYISLPLVRPMIVDNKSRIDRIKVKILNYDQAMAAEGKTSVIVTIPSVHEFWVNLRQNNPRRYKVEKERIAKEIIGILDKKFEGLAGKVEVYDVSTPATYIRYTGNWCASIGGWLQTPELIGKKMQSTLPGLINFYMAGQWIEPGGGLHQAALSGRNTAQIICSKDNKKFVTIR